jgi:hypothetical protein
MVERLNAYLSARPYVDKGHLAKRIERISHQLELGDVDIDTLRRWATEFGRRGLVEQLATMD